MVKSEIEQLLDTPLTDFSNNNSSGWRGRRGRGGSSQRGGGSWRGRGQRGSRGRTHVSGLSSNVPSRRWKENENSSELPPRGGHWRGGDSFSTRRRTSGTRSTTRRRTKSPPPVVISTSGDIIVTGLDSSITSDDVRDIFSERIGVPTKAYVVFDKSGKSKGEAHVTFAKRSDAKKAVDTLDKALVDEKKIRIRLVSSNSAGLIVRSPSSDRDPRPSKRARVSPNTRKGRGFDGNAGRRSTGYGSFQSYRGSSSRVSDIPPDVSNPLDRGNNLQMNSPIRRGGGRGRGRGEYQHRGRGGGRGGSRGRGWGRGRGGGDSWNDDSVTAEDLDRELESYLK